ncbi:MAG: hypothetical protein GY778_19210, partial [bacterium]|nr:hypothetical protein [bacterium]
MIFFFYLPTVACVVLGFLYLNSATTTVITKGIVVGVVGLGYVGLPLIRAFVGAGFRAMGFDVDRAKVDRLAAGESYIEHIP